jgi:hypothetical protein
MSCSSNGSSIEPSAVSVASAKVPGQRKSGVMKPGVRDGKNLKRNGKNGVEVLINVLAKKGMSVDQFVTASLRLDSVFHGPDEEEVEEGVFMGDASEVSPSKRSKIQVLNPAMSVNLVGAHGEPHQEQ